LILQWASALAAERDCTYVMSSHAASEKDSSQLFRKLGVVGLFISLGNFFSGLFPSV
jgi:hypothetical protein